MSAQFEFCVTRVTGADKMDVYLKPELVPADDPHWNHPLKLRDYVIPTPAIQNAVAEACRVIDSRISGAAFISQPRFGKTTAIDYVIPAVRAILPGRAYLVISPPKRDAGKQVSLYTDVLRAMNSSLALTGTGEDRLDRAVLGLFMKTAEAGANQLVMVIDEAQGYGANELEGLLTLSNALWEKWRIRMTTLLWGQPSLWNVFTGLQEIHRRDLTGRFMPWFLPFKGICSAGELAMVLTMLDRKSEFPAGSGQSYVAAFLPKAVARGFTMAQCAGPLWAAYHDAIQPHHGEFEVGMEWVSLAIEELIVGNACHDCSGWRPNAETYQLAVQSTGFAKAFVECYFPQPAGARGRVGERAA